ncbi:protein mono-ADP-ribosyltransferase PARP16-like [Tigriopus californicus]|uniref:protein mono-ADP-ribosyltransferase PARP16-like n=1 Tax=Tigriopus californicus TaxID=6832 RepID=UPI0027DA78B0|nr:protein mono-ADP-ribosyltransferase PARP16-like [Tigriopus californicus]
MEEDTPSSPAPLASDIHPVTGGSSPHPLKMNLSEKRAQILRSLQDDLWACDLQLSLFISAAAHYRHDSVLRPYPAHYCRPHEKSKDIKALRRDLATIPNLIHLRQLLASNTSIPRPTIHLIYWILLENPLDLRLQLVPKSEYDDILAWPGLNEKTKTTGLQPKKAPKPTHIFQVKNSKSVRWSRTSDTKTMFAFHGSKVENFHSILSHGLQQHLTKNALFGQGIYLSTDLSMCMNYSQIGQGWSQSSICQQFSCVLMCEVQDHPEVKIHTKDPSRGQLKDSQAGKVPEKYLIVRNNEVIQNRYLLVYADPPQRTRSLQRMDMSWIRNNWILILVLCYGVLLLAIAVKNSNSFRRWLRINGLISD